MLQKKTVVLLVILAFCQVQQAYARQDQFVIRLGSQSNLVYDLQKGSYSVSWNGKQLIRDAYSTCYTNHAIDSRNAGRATVQVSDFHNSIGKGKLYTISFTGNKILQQLFYVFNQSDYFITQLKLNNPGTGASYMAPLMADNLQWPEAGDNRALYVPFDNDMWARFNASPLAEADFKSSELTSIYNAGNQKGIVIGSLEQNTWKSGISVKGKSATALSAIAAFAGFSDTTVTHDRIPHGNVLPVNGVIYSPQFLIGCFKDWRNGMETFASLNAKLHPRVIFNWDRPTPMGWNSWGVLREKITYDQAIGVVNFFADSCKDFRTTDNTLFIDLDAFWDNMTPGGIDGDVSKLKTFVAHCTTKGLKPGIYWTPFTDWGKSDKKIEGADAGYTYAQVWTTQDGKMLDIDGGRAMDPTHPATRQRIVHTINKLKALGFEMIKIDFLGHAAQEADKFYDPSVTTGMQAFNSGMAFLDSVLGRQMLVYAAISPSLATSRYVHVRRIACDAFSSLEHTEYTLNSTGYGWWQDQMYNYMDADHVVFATEKEGVNRARLAAALVTGTLITGDDFSTTGKWIATAKKLLQNNELLEIIKDGKAFRPLQANTGNKGVELFIKKMGKTTYIACFNYTTTVKPLSLLTLFSTANTKRNHTVKALFTGQTFKIKDTAAGQLPGEDVEIYRITTGN